MLSQKTISKRVTNSALMYCNRILLLKKHADILNMCFMHIANAYILLSDEGTFYAFLLN